MTSPPDSAVFRWLRVLQQSPPCPPSRAGDVRGADAVAVGDRSEPLHRRAEQPAECLRFRLAQLRELGRHVRNRAVMLAELLAAFGLDPSPIAGPGLRRRRSRRRTAPRPVPGPGGPGRPGYRRRVPALQVGHLPAGELGDRVRARRLGQEAQCVGRQVVVGVLERAAARVGDDETLAGRPRPRFP